jgi:hypothetical protein
MSKRYSIKITYPTVTCYMSFMGRTSWCYSQARKHLKEWVYLHGITAELEENA